MNITVIPRVAAPGILRLWVGVEAVALPALTWELDGIASNPAILRPLQSTIPAAWLNGPADNFSGLFEFNGLQSGTSHRVRIVPNGAQDKAKMLSVGILPEDIPSVFDRPFNVLLASCFHQHEDNGEVAAVAQRLTGQRTPDLTLLMGDQVYLDLPTLRNFPSESAALAAKFDQDYRVNWQAESTYRPLLQLAPTASLPDDHEYWNNFPHTSPVIQNSWTATGRANWQAAAQALFDSYQCAGEPKTFHHGGPQKTGDAQVFEVGPLSFFLADGRSERQFDKRAMFTTRSMSQLQAWVKECVDKRQLAIFVTGQSLLDKGVSKAEGVVADYTMPNYGDFGDLTSELRKVPAAGLPLLLLTGDVHWGRVTVATDAVTRAPVTEVISSPSSLVSTVGKDDWARIWGKVTGQNMWPRHSKAQQPSPFLWAQLLGKNYPCETRHEQQGNHVSMLSFSRHGTGIQLRITYFPVHKNLAVRNDIRSVDLQYSL